MNRLIRCFHKSQTKEVKLKTQIINKNFDEERSLYNLVEFSFCP